jgi:sugar/nucleoside kinase (ribokinase family)
MPATNRARSGSPKPTPRVLCVGDMAADIFSSPLPRLPDPGELILTNQIAFFPGGNALNTAVALQRLGEPTAFFGSLGDDAFGDLLLFELGKIGLDVRGVRREPGAATPTTLIVRAEGEDRRFVHALGAGDRFTGSGLSLDLIPNDGVVLAAGYLKLRSWDDTALAQLFGHARARGSTVVLNVCIPIQGDVDPTRCLRLLPQVDVFVPNQDEARILTGESQPADQARLLRQAGARMVIITRGQQGLYATDGLQAIEMGVFAVEMIDPSGCGDCFTAGLIAGLLRRWELRRTLTFASAAGALGATALGCTSGVPPLDAVERFVNEHTVAVSLRTLSRPDQ